MKYWVASDYHFGHKNKMIELCQRPPNYEYLIIKNLSCIPDDDCLIFLGDYCFGRDMFYHSLMSGFSFKKIYIKGNHCPKSYSWYMDHGWDFACETMTLHIYGKRIIFSHKPIELAGHDLNVHGHVHNKDPKELAESLCVTPGHVLVKSEHTYRPQLLRSLVR